MPLLRCLVSALLVVVVCGTRAFADTAEDALWNAIDVNNLPGVKAALAAGAEPSESTRPFLSLAAQKGNLEIIKALLGAKARMNTGSLDTGPVLVSALGNQRDNQDRLEIVRQLLTAGVLRATNDGGAGAVKKAFLNGQTNIGQLLLQAGAHVETEGEPGPSVLHELLARPVADEAEIEPTAKLLLTAGAEPQRKDRQGRNAADLAAEYGLLKTLVLLEPGNPNKRDLGTIKQRGLDRQLIAAIARHNSSRMHWMNPPPDQPGPQIAVIKARLEAGANPRISLRLWGEWDRTALGILLDGSTAPPTEADPEVLDLLLVHGASWDDLGKNRNRRLKEVLAIPGLAEVAVQRGLRGDAPISAFAPTPRGDGKEIPSTLLHAAAEGGVVKAVGALLQAGGQLDGIDGGGYTPLARAVAAGQEEVTVFLLKRGARTDGVTADGLSLADLAAQANNRPRIQLWDRDGRYQELLAGFSPSKGSRWVGEWMMGDPKYPSKVTLAADGSGQGGGGSAMLMWTEIDGGVRLRLARRNRLGLPGRAVELDLLADETGRLKAKNREYGDQMRLWRPESPPDPAGEKQVADTESKRRLEAKIDEQIAALESKRSDGFWLESGLPLTGLPERVWQETRWRHFTVQGGEIGTLPRALSNLGQLQSVDIANQKNLQIEDGALRLPKLETLYLRSTGLMALSLEWEHLPLLNEVKIDDSRLEQLPTGWAGARNLKWFGAGRSRIHSLPEDIGAAPVLKTLAVAGNQLTALPASIAKSLIEELYLDDNRFTQLPSVLQGMTRLRSLSMAQNRLTGLKPGDLPASLLHLNLGGNRLTQAPDVRPLTRLETLNLSRNALEELPDDPAWLPASVQELDVSGNRLKHMPAWLLERPFNRLNLGQNAWPDEQAREIAQQAQKRWRETQRK